jgi:hypothetical protein
MPVITGYEVVTDTLTVTNQQFDAVLTVAAPEGKKVIGGGASLTRPPGNAWQFVIAGSYPVDDETGWRAVAANVSGGSQSTVLTVWAICGAVDTALEICEAD